MHPQSRNDYSKLRLDSGPSSPRMDSNRSLTIKMKNNIKQQLQGGITERTNSSDDESEFFKENSKQNVSKMSNSKAEEAPENENRLP